MLLDFLVLEDDLFQSRLFSILRFEKPGPASKSPSPGRCCSKVYSAAKCQLKGCLSAIIGASVPLAFSSLPSTHLNYLADRTTIHNIGLLGQFCSVIAYYGLIAMRRSREKFQRRRIPAQFFMASPLQLHDSCGICALMPAVVGRPCRVARVRNAEE